MKIRNRLPHYKYLKKIGIPFQKTSIHLKIRVITNDFRFKFKFFFFRQHNVILSSASKLFLSLFYLHLDSADVIRFIFFYFLSSFSTS